MGCIGNVCIIFWIPSLCSLVYFFDGYSLCCLKKYFIKNGKSSMLLKKDELTHQYSLNYYHKYFAVFIMIFGFCCSFIGFYISFVGEVSN